MTCTSCGQDLIRKPKINVEGAIYCFRCSKQTVADKHAARRDAAEVQHGREIESYMGEKAKFDKAYQEWSRKRSEFIDAEMPGWVAGVSGMVVCYFIGEDIKKGIGLLGVICGLVIWAIVALRVSNKRDSEFRSLFPAPMFALPYPPSPKVSPVVHKPHFDAESDLQIGNLREEILRRDKLTCQACGQKKQRKNLEVHHIVPRAKGGQIPLKI